METRNEICIVYLLFQLYSASIFLDAGNGWQALISGGFPVIQVELFDFLILIFTVLFMILFMPCKQKEEKAKNKVKHWQCLVCGVVFSFVLMVLNEFILPLCGIQNTANALHVSAPNLPFFYAVMITGSILAGYLVSYKALSSKDRNDHFCLKYGIFIWCVFDLTMIPLGFGIMPTVFFIAVSMIAFVSIDMLCQFYAKNEH